MHCIKNLFALAVLFIFTACGNVEVKPDDALKAGDGEGATPAPVEEENITPEQARAICAAFAGLDDKSLISVEDTIDVYAWCSQFGDRTRARAYQMAARNVISTSREDRDHYRDAFALAEKKKVETPKVLDFDHDGVVVDNCPGDANTDQSDYDADGIGDVCDNARGGANPDQKDTDEDGIGDAGDNCPQIANADQNDTDRDGIGDVCDNCFDTKNADQANADNDKIGDVCDNAPHNPNDDQKDTDGDGFGDVGDTCPKDKNLERDTDEDGVDDACDACPDDKSYSREAPDNDKDGIVDCKDNASSIFNPDQFDSDSDGVADVIDNCPGIQNGSAQIDVDHVGNQTDKDSDKIGDACDACPNGEPRDSGLGCWPDSTPIASDDVEVKIGNTRVIISAGADPWQTKSGADTFQRGVMIDPAKEVARLPQSADQELVRKAFSSRLPDAAKRIGNCVWTDRLVEQGGRTFYLTFSFVSGIVSLRSPAAKCGVVVVVEPKRALPPSKK